MFFFKGDQGNIHFYDYFFILLNPFISWFFSHSPSSFFLARVIPLSNAAVLQPLCCFTGSSFRPYATECLICWYYHVWFACSCINKYIRGTKTITCGKLQLTGYAVRSLNRCKKNKCSVKKEKSIFFDHS